MFGLRLVPKSNGVKKICQLEMEGTLDFGR